MSEITVEPKQFNKQSHINYFLKCLKILPSHYTSLDTSKLTALYFIIIGLDMLKSVHLINKQEIISFIYQHQLSTDNFPLPDNNDSMNCEGIFGFIGSCYLNHHKIDDINNSSNLIVFQGHIAMSYTALMILITLDDDLSNLNKISLLQGLKKLQQPNGSFSATIDGSEADMRFLFCACAISYVLNDWSGINTELSISYIKSCISYDGGLSLTPNLQESHGGACYCGIASLVLMNRLNDLSSSQINCLKKWCFSRQVNGFQGRINKDPDSCYSFWVGGTISLLNDFDLTDKLSTHNFLINNCQYFENYGGFCKTPDSHPDILHTFYSLCWLAMEGIEDLNPIDVKLGICKRN